MYKKCLGSIRGSVLDIVLISDDTVFVPSQHFYLVLNLLGSFCDFTYDGFDSYI